MIKNMKNIGEGTELSRHFYLENTKVKMKCWCGKILEADLSANYLYYPTVGEHEDLYFYCDECGKDFEGDVTIKLSINAEVYYYDDMLFTDE